MLGCLAQRLGPRSTNHQSLRFLRARWERTYLKDLYHRRQLLGADPILHRSSYPNWNYSSELYAFGHRLGVPEIPVDLLVQALTTESFASRRDVELDAVSPNHDESHSLEHNLDLSAKGIASISRILSSYLRAQLSDAPEELIQAISLQLTNDETLADIARHLGIDVLIRTAENPPSVSSIATSFQALCGALAEDKVQQLVFNFVVPQLLDVDFVDVFPLNDPLAVLTDLLKIDGVSEVEPRILRSAGVNSAHPVYVVGIFRDKLDIVGESAGETLEVAVDMAARNGLLRLWGLTSDRVFFFGDKINAISLNDFKKENYRLSDKCAKSTDLSVQQDASEDPINVVEVAMRYKEDVESVVGKSYTKRLRHKFSRGSLAKRSFRYLVKPKVYTIA